MKSARQMRWYFENKKKEDDGLLWYPCDGKAWTHFDKKKKIDVYLYPLINDLQQLWNDFDKKKHCDVSLLDEDNQ